MSAKLVIGFKYKQKFNLIPTNYYPLHLAIPIEIHNLISWQLKSSLAWNNFVYPLNVIKINNAIHTDQLAISFQTNIKSFSVNILSVSKYIVAS
jgi:hypothetical protein